MVRFQCDTCGRLKEGDEAWILGLAAQNIGVTSARREVEIAAVWDRARAVETLAVHFCSDQCRAEYLSALFGDTPETQAGEVTVTKRRIKRYIPGGVVDTIVGEKREPTVFKPAVVKKPVARKKRA
jgi:hypothetical protein